MSIEKTTQPYELLIRIKDGEVVGAHQRDLEVIADGDTVYSAKELDAKPIKLTAANKKYLKGLLNG